MNAPPACALPNASRTSGERFSRLAVLIIVLAGLAAYANSLSDAFVLDDIDSIVSNQAIRHLWPPWKFFASPHRPILNLSLAVSFALSGGAAGPRGLNPASFHAFNIVVHILAALTLFGLVRRTLGLPALQARFEGAATPLALATALLWEVHPLQTESVTYVVQRAESLAGLFYLLTLYALIRAATSETATPLDRENAKARKVEERRRIGSFPSDSFAFSRFRGQPSVVVWSIVAVAACALGMGTKETVATAPLVVFLYDWIFLSGSYLGTVRRRWALYLALAATWTLPILVLLSPAGRQPASAGFQMAGIAPMDYAVTQLGVILHYLRLSFWPAGLCLDYHWPLAKGLGDILPGAAVVGALLAATAAALAMRPKWGFLGAWFFLTLAPTSSFMPIADAAAERRMYLPLAAVIAFVVISGWLLLGRLARLGGLGRPSANRLGREEAQEAQQKAGITSSVSCASLRQYEVGRPSRRWTAAVFLAVAVLGYLTALRNLDYRSEFSIWNDTVRKAPDNPRAFDGRGTAYFDKQDYQRAIEDHSAAIRLNANYAPAWNGRAIVYNELRRFDDALNDSSEAVRLDPDFPIFHNTRGVVLARMGRFDAAIREYDEAVRLNPGFAEAFMNRGVAREKAGQPAQALADYDRALALTPDYPSAWFNRGNAHSEQGDYDLAIGDYTRAIALKRDYPLAFYGRALAWYYKKDYRRSWADIRALLELGAEPPPQFLRALKAAAPASD